MKIQLEAGEVFDAIRMYMNSTIGTDPGDVAAVRLVRIAGTEGDAYAIVDIIEGNGPSVLRAAHRGKEERK